jgi:hypothetical protein
MLLGTGNTQHCRSFEDMNHFLSHKMWYGQLNMQHNWGLDVQSGRETSARQPRKLVMEFFPPFGWSSQRKKLGGALILLPIHSHLLWGQQWHRNTPISSAKAATWEDGNWFWLIVSPPRAVQWPVHYVWMNCNKQTQQKLTFRPVNMPQIQCPPKHPIQ